MLSKSLFMIHKTHAMHPNPEPCVRLAGLTSCFALHAGCNASSLRGTPLCEQLPAGSGVVCFGLDIIGTGAKQELIQAAVCTGAEDGVQLRRSFC